MTVAVVMPEQLSGAQVKALRELISLNFNLDELTILTREIFERKLTTVVDVSKPFDVVVYNWIEWCERESLLQTLVLAVSERKPHRKLVIEAILSGEQGEQSPATPPIDPTMRDEFRDEFRERRRWFGFLNAYKELHDLLHNLAGNLRQLREESDARTRLGTSIPPTTIANLREWVTNAQRWASATEFPKAPPLSVWVPRFGTAVDSFSSTEATAHEHALAFARISQLPSQQLGHLNSELVACARRLRTDELVESLDNLPIHAPKLTDLVARFRDPCTRLQDLIRDHDLCQQIDTELRLAVGLAEINPKALLNWADVERWLAELGTNRPGEFRVTRTQKSAADFQRNPSPETFQDLVERFDDLFKKTDEALLRVTNHLVNAAADLSEAFEGLR